MPATAASSCPWATSKFTEAAPGERVCQVVGQQRSTQTNLDSAASRSIAVMKALLVKRKSSVVDVPKPPAMKKRKLSSSRAICEVPVVE